MPGHSPPIRPGTITAVQVISWIKVGLLSLAACALLAVPSQAGTTHPEVGVPVMVLLVIASANLIAFAVMAINIAKGRNWARIMTIVVEAINLASALYLLGSPDRSISQVSIIGVILSFVVLVSATQPESRHHCPETSADANI